MEEKEKSPRERVIEKFNMGADLKKSKITTSVRLEIVDSKIKANFEIRGLPEKRVNGNYISSSYRDYTKIFDDFDDFAEYTKTFLAKSDEDLIKLANAT